MEQTLAVIKPLAFKNNLIGPIINQITLAGFDIKAIRSVQLSRAQAEELYEMHKHKGFFPDLISYVTSGPIVVMILEKENAIEDFRKLMGNTDPTKAEAGTIRRLYGSDKTRNAVHGSDSPVNAKREISLFFS